MFDASVQADRTAAAERTGARDAMFLHVQLRRADQAEAGAPMRVRNLSSGGMMVETAETFARGEPVRVTLRNIGEVGGRIAWSSNGRIGVAFDRAIDPREARRPAAPAAGTTMLLMKLPSATTSRRPGLKIG